MSWVEVGGAGCSLESVGGGGVHGLVIPLIFYIFEYGAECGGKCSAQSGAK